MHEHDGLYLRIALGIGYVGANVQSDGSTDYRGSVRGSLGGGAGTVELALGGTPAPGLVVGGGIFFAGAGNARSKSLDVNGAPLGQARFDHLNVLLVGPFVDYFFDPHGGWHIQGALGAASLAIGRSTHDGVTQNARNLAGAGLSLGGGYEWWVGDQWSLGILLRGTWIGVANNTDGESWTAGALALPELLLSVSFQ